VAMGPVLHVTSHIFDFVISRVRVCIVEKLDPAVVYLVICMVSLRTVFLKLLRP
jgi:hypothetical protein